MNTSDTQNPQDSSRPFGYWLKAVDRLMAAEFAAAFDDEHANRRDWRLLTAVDGTVPPRRPLAPHKLHRLVERGWIVETDDGWTLTDDGRAAKDRLGGLVDGIRAKVSDAVTDEEMATTLASLEKIARALGWDEETSLPRGRGRGHGRRHGHGFGGHGFGRHAFPGRRFGHDAHGHHEHGHHGHHAEHAYERGFDAGFSRGRDA